MPTSPDTHRVCFRLRIRVDHVDAYVARHAQVWPEMRDEIARAGRRNYSLFLDRDDERDGTVGLVGYYETDDDAAAQAFLAASPVAGRWEAEMAPFFAGIGGRADQHAHRLAEVMHLAGGTLPTGSTSPKDTA